MPEESNTIPRDQITVKPGQAVYLSHPAKDGRLLRFHLLFERQVYGGRSPSIPFHDICLITVREATEDYEPVEFFQLLATPCNGDMVPLVLALDQDRRPILCNLKVQQASSHYTLYVDSDQPVQLMAEELLSKTLTNVN